MDTQSGSGRDLLRLGQFTTARMCSHSSRPKCAHTHHGSHLLTLSTAHTYTHSKQIVRVRKPQLMCAHTHHSLHLSTLTMIYVCSHSPTAHMLTLTVVCWCSQSPRPTCAHTHRLSHVLTLALAHMCSQSPLLTCAHTHHGSQVLTLTKTHKMS